MIDTKTSESLDKLPARKSIGHSRLFGGARRVQGGTEMREDEEKREKERIPNEYERERKGEDEALRTGYVPDWFRYCSH